MKPKPKIGRNLLSSLALLLLWMALPGFTGNNGNCEDGICAGGGEENPELLSRVKRYVQHFLKYDPAAEQEVLFIVPYEGCPYCVEKVIGFYLNLRQDRQMSSSDLVLAGSGAEAAHAAPRFDELQSKVSHYDNRNMITRYGIGSVYPIAVYFEGGQVSKVRTMNADSMEEVQNEILNYLSS